MSTTIVLPPGVKRSYGRDLSPPPNVVKLASGALLRHSGEWIAGPDGLPWAKVYRGPHELSVLVSLDPHGGPLGTLLHMSLSLPRGYPDWDLIYAVTRAIFGEHVDAMMPIPREEAFIHGALPEQGKGIRRQVFHCVEMPAAWPREGQR